MPGGGRLQNQKSIQILVFRQVVDTSVYFFGYDTPNSGCIMPVHIAILVSEFQKSGKERAVIVFGKETGHNALAVSG
jgi:hypothetical protein